MYIISAPKLHEKGGIHSTESKGSRQMMERRKKTQVKGWGVEERKAKSS